MLWKTILTSIRSSPFFTFLIVLGVLFDLLFQYFSSLSYKYLIDKALMPRDIEALAIIVGVLLALGLLNVIAGISSDYAKAKLGAKMLFDYRLSLFRHMLPQSHRFYERFQVGDLLARYSEDIPVIKTAVLQTFSGGLLSALSVVIGLSILFTMEWKLTLLALGGSILVFIPYRMFRNRSLALANVYYGHLEQFNGSIDESMKAYRVIRVFDLRQSMLTKVEGILHTMASIGVKRSFVDSNLNRMPVLAISILTAIILAYGSYLTFDGRLSIGEFIAFNSIFVTVGQSMYGISAVLPHFLAARTSLQRLQQVMDWKPDVTERGVQELPTIRTHVELRDVTFAYVPGEPVLRHFDLSIPLSGHTSIVGASGSGKSTVLQLMLRFADPESGAVLYDGRDIREARYASLLGQVGIVFQDSILFHASIRDNIVVGKPDATKEEMEEAARAAGIHETIIGFRDGYDTVIRNHGDNLSGGQRQRIALARALLRSPNVLFLDEATSALDPDTEQSVNETILSLGRSRPIISVTHRLAYAALSDRIIVLDKGRVAESGSHEQLMEQDGVYRRMWEKQQGFVLSRGGGSAQVQADRLQQLPFFQGIEQGALDQISRLFVAEKFEAGEAVVEQGDQGEKFYLIARGKVEIVVTSKSGERRKVAVLEDGDHFGEIALMQHIPRTATVVTATTCLLLSLSYEHFHPLMMRHSSIREALEATLQTRMQGREKIHASMDSR
ncbi:ABC transporter transmembrane domain-containing protein [Paenibacillus planticolens]|uniref:ATP-binding cassette domain-containing protein n=1 Tax=Paenibacillus planticolens TaxID=2654976 RepID=A0ABX1ZP87_9BACL|nr:ABC transporter transmembrane domain-containing protein [Paenibacillus planticolens]NOV01904.1 ATP-binding cassette domain-containing protein [Paenibacillus planticolens]